VLILKKASISESYFQFLNESVLTYLDLLKAYEDEDLFAIKDSAQTGMTRIIDLARKVRMPLGGTVAHHFGYKIVDPTGSEEMIEYCYSLTNSAFFVEDGTTRNVARKMMAGHLPDEIRLETKVGLQSSDITARLQHTSLEVNLHY
jgi:hypothetical protein